MALGEQPAAELWQAASEGKFKLEPDAAREVAGHYQWFADEMVKRQHELVELQKLEGFGAFVSAQHLQSGFEQKAVQAFDAYKTAEKSALKMKAAVLKAAQLIEEADAANSAAIEAANRKIPDVQAKF